MLNTIREQPTHLFLLGIERRHVALARR
jgi:hypothetical protein